MIALVIFAILIIAIAWHLWHVYRGDVDPGGDELLPAPMAEPTAPSGVFLDAHHVWARVSADGALRVGIDALLAGALGDADAVELPARGRRVERGETLFRVRVKGRTIDIPSPVAGEVVKRHLEMASRPWVTTLDPYGSGWVVALRSDDPRGAVMDLDTGPAATAHLRKEWRRYRSFLGVDEDSALLRGAAARLDDAGFRAFSLAFVGSRAEVGDGGERRHEATRAGGARGSHAAL